MTFVEKIKQPRFWTNVVKIAIPFFIVMVIIMLLINNFKDIIAFDFNSIAESNFTNGKWKRFFAIKLLFSFMYAFWLTLRKTN